MSRQETPDEFYSWETKPATTNVNDETPLCDEKENRRSSLNDSELNITIANE